ncbi:phage Gp37/Gp68 family protein [Leptospira licerasiae]|uniref:DUF5131 family protein n=1 Tax=Leptospira licerasiae TaxID=447106 RepID=UPI0030176D95
MAGNSKIEWTEATWNPVTGCTKVSLGCKNCYAETLTKRFEKTWGPFSNVKLHPQRLQIPLKRKQPTVYFVNSMSDIFHEKVSNEFIFEMFKIMNNCPEHTFQILTKRPERLLELDSKLNWTPNIWMGVSIENRISYHRLYPLKRCGAKVKFLSLEPLLESVIDIEIIGIDWVIVGGESGLRARPLMEEWVIEIKTICFRNNIPFFFKQWGGKWKKEGGRELGGMEYNQIPNGVSLKKYEHARSD